jgi:hypothetical protein
MWLVTRRADCQDGRRSRGVLRLPALRTRPATWVGGRSAPHPRRGRRLGGGTARPRRCARDRHRSPREVMQRRRRPGLPAFLHTIDRNTSSDVDLIACSTTTRLTPRGRACRPSRARRLRTSYRPLVRRRWLVPDMVNSWPMLAQRRHRHRHGQLRRSGSGAALAGVRRLGGEAQRGGCLGGPEHEAEHARAGTGPFGAIDST